MPSQQDTRVARVIKSLKRGFLTYSLIIVGILIIGASAIEYFPIGALTEHEETIKQAKIDLFYSCLGLICLVLGMERAVDVAKVQTAIEDQNKVLDQLKTDLQNALGGNQNLLHSIDEHLSRFNQYKLLESYEEIYTTSLKLMQGAKTNIRSIVYANSPKAPDDWNQRVAKILRDKADNSTPVQFDIVICMNRDDFTAPFIERTNQRYDLYKAEGVESFFHRYLQFMERPIGFDCLIIDNHHMIMSFPLIVSNKTQKAILMMNQQDTITNFVNWFNSLVMFEAISFNNAVKLTQTKSPIS